jgi:hypothetical protein
VDLTNSTSFMEMITMIIEEKENFIDTGRMIVWDYQTLDRRHSWCLYSPGQINNEIKYYLKENCDR